jgi:hypothetical protein
VLMKKVTLAVICLLAALAVGCTTSTSTASEASKKPQTTEANRATDGCDPNYSGGVPIASDVDCAGGGGNGPAYVKGPVRVIGKDIYGLDRDGDGIGCE